MTEVQGFFSNLSKKNCSFSKRKTFSQAKTIDCKYVAKKAANP